MTPKLGLPYISPTQAQKEVTHNEGLNLLDMLVQASVIDSVTTEPVGGETDGQAWIVAGPATGAWAGQEGNIALWFGGWTFLAPDAGWQVWDTALGLHLVYDGAAWTPWLGEWQTPALNLSWIGLGGGWQNPRYRRNRAGLVTIEGAMQHMSASTDGVIFTLPADYRPAADLIFTGWTAGGPCRWNVYANGDVEVAASNMFGTSFSGISFYTA